MGDVIATTLLTASICARVILQFPKLRGYHCNLAQLKKPRLQAGRAVPKWGMSLQIDALFRLASSAKTCNPITLGNFMIYCSIYCKSSLSNRFLLVIGDNLQSQQPGFNNIKLPGTESGIKGLDLRNLQDESPLDSNDSSCSFLFMKT